jgi:hypothetical protein
MVPELRFRIRPSGRARVGRIWTDPQDSRHLWLSRVPCCLTSSRTRASMDWTAGFGGGVVAWVERVGRDRATWRVRYVRDDGSLGSVSGFRS